jgi:chloramphenicol 3-O-phosphotransferase
MSQSLVILRGPAASGKTTLCESLRDYDKKIVWLSVDKMKPIFSDFEDRTLEDANKASIAMLKYLLDEGYSVIYEGIFKNPDCVYQAIKIGKDKNIPTVAYQLKSSLGTLLSRDKTRKGVKEGWRKPLGDEIIEGLHQKNIDNPINSAIDLDTENQSIEECVRIIRKNFE